MYLFHLDCFQRALCSFCYTQGQEATGGHCLEENINKQKNNHHQSGHP